MHARDSLIMTLCTEMRHGLLEFNQTKRRRVRYPTGVASQNDNGRGLLSIADGEGVSFCFIYLVFR